MILNKEVFYRDPTKYTLPNDGVAKVTEPKSDQEWAVARYELNNLSVKALMEGLRRILNLIWKTSANLLNGPLGCMVLWLW